MKEACVLCCLWLVCLFSQAQPRMFTHIDAFDGLSDNKIQHILQLADGRMVFTTPRTINLYDGARFRYFPIHKEHILPLPAYEGAYHIYIGRNDLLWIKDYKTIACFDVRRERYITDLYPLIQKMNGSKKPVADLFLDSDRTIWLVRTDGTVWNTVLKKEFRFPQILGAQSASHLGKLQDIDVLNGCGYFFFSSGKVVIVSLKDSRLLNISSAYSALEADSYDKMSLVVKGPNGDFYQLRNGKRAICLKLSTNDFRWKTLLRSSDVLHTLIVPTKESAYITCGKGLWKIELNSGRTLYTPSLQMADGSSITTNINTVFKDRDGGWWLGTFDKGLLYGHSWRDIYIERNNSGLVLSGKIFHPILINVSVNGKSVPLQTDKKDTLLPLSTPYIRHFELESTQNTLSFDFSALNYALPMHTCYRYRLISTSDSTWHDVTFNTLSKSMDERGVLHLSFSRLDPGEYRLQVKAANIKSALKKAPSTELTFHIRVSWWQTYWACCIYVIITGAIIAGGCMFYKNQKEQHKKEQLLLDRIKDLIERCNRYEQEKADNSRIEQEQLIPSPLNFQDNEFLQRAISLVKSHLNGTYSVEELSRDLCMERTGLYKKLTALLDQSPSLFIRNIRLQQAACLLSEKKKSISDVALETGFSSPSYFSKCFQEMYGCKPSEYAGRQQKST